MDRGARGSADGQNSLMRAKRAEIYETTAVLRQHPGWAAYGSRLLPRPYRKPKLPCALTDSQDVHYALLALLNERTSERRPAGAACGVAAVLARRRPALPLISARRDTHLA